MNTDDLKRHFPNASAATLAANAEGAGTPAKLERDSSDGALGAAQVQEPASSRVLVVITSVRRRLLDEDNLCEKFHCDLLRYAGVLSDDSPEQTEIRVCQRKARKGEEEFTLIQVYEP